MRNPLLEDMKRRQKARQVEALQRAGMWSVIIVGVLLGAYELVIKLV
jgi:hypothetical protein